MPSRCSGSTSNGPSQRVGEVLHDGQQRPADARPSTTPRTAAAAPSTTPRGEDDAARLLRRTAAGRHQRQRARLTARADGERRPGQQHHLEQGHHHDQHERGDVGVVGLVSSPGSSRRQLGVRRRVVDDCAGEDERADGVERAHLVPADRTAADQPGSLGVGRVWSSSRASPAGRAAPGSAFARRRLRDADDGEASGRRARVRVAPTAKPLSASARLTVTSSAVDGQLRTSAGTGRRPRASRCPPRSVGADHAALGVDVEAALGALGGGTSRPRTCGPSRG